MYTIYKSVEIVSKNPYGEKLLRKATKRLQGKRCSKFTIKSAT